MLVRALLSIGGLSLIDKLAKAPRSNHGSTVNMVGHEPSSNDRSCLYRAFTHLDRLRSVNRAQPLATADMPSRVRSGQNDIDSRRRE